MNKDFIFDWKFYINMNPDLIDIRNENDAINHFNNHGKFENRIFDKVQYNNFNHLLYIKINNLQHFKNKQDAYFHYTLHSNSEDIFYKNFNWIFYIKYYNDLKHIDTEEKAIDHFIKNGIFEDRICTVEELNNRNITNYCFNWKFYKFLYEDFTNIHTEDELINHYYSHGKLENRITSKFDNKYRLFDWKYYLEMNSDLTNLNITTQNEAFKHYLNYGIKEKRKINSFETFDWIFYTKKYGLNDINTRNGSIYHYLTHDNFIFINQDVYNEYENFNWIKYKEYYNINELNDKYDLYLYYLKYGLKNGHIYFHNTYDDNTINTNLGITISVYIDKNTPPERILCSKICLNSVIRYCNNIPIIIVIDNLIINEHMKYILDLTDNKKNIKIYINNENYGIAKTKNIGIKLLENLNVKYICMLDDDIEIKKNFTDYVINIFEKTNIPLLSNYNFELPFEKIIYNDIQFIKTNNYFGNFIALNSTFIRKYGYMANFKYKWGEEHIELTNRYLINTLFENYAIDLNGYIENYQIINNKNTLHLHSCNVDFNKVEENKKMLEELLKNIQYIDFNLNKNEVKEISILDINKKKLLINFFKECHNLIDNYIKLFTDDEYYDLNLNNNSIKLINKLNKDFNLMSNENKNILKKTD